MFFLFLQRLSTTPHVVRHTGLSQRTKTRIRVMHIFEAYFVYQVGDLRRREKERVEGGWESMRVVKGECEVYEV